MYNVVMVQGNSDVWCGKTEQRHASAASRNQTTGRMILVSSCSRSAFPSFDSYLVTAVAAAVDSL